MFDFYQRRKLRSLVNSPLTQGVLVLLALFVGWSAYERYDIAMMMSERRALAESQTAALEARRAALEERVDYLSHERGIEAEMRRQFDVALPGEQVVVIVDDVARESEIQPLSTSTNQQSEKKWYQFWR